MEIASVITAHHILTAKGLYRSNIILSFSCLCTSYHKPSKSLMVLQVLSFSAGVSHFNLKPLWCKMIGAEVIESPSV